jgi:hypothetical protein
MAIHEHIPLLSSHNYLAIAAALRKLQAVFFLCTIVFLRCSTVRAVLLLIILIEWLCLALHSNVLVVCGVTVIVSAADAILGLAVHLTVGIILVYRVLNV